MARLEEALRLARGLYDHGAVTFEGAHVRRPRPPAVPGAGAPPALLVGGGSDRVLRMAGRYALDHSRTPSRTGLHASGE
jgi:alkanesulfonate monooxygenase SsuD/methylene tetrahydromethanopterin reductase-like flavin-dependent oxidoreductase (luciferase family)